MEERSHNDSRLIMGVIHAETYIKLSTLIYDFVALFVHLNSGEGNGSESCGLNSEG